MNSFADDVLQGLTSTEKYLSSKYFYNTRGSKIFREIMAMPEYYLTDSEFEILTSQAGKIVDALGFNQTFGIVELGAGDGKKTFELLEYLSVNNYPFYYMPIDISKAAIDNLTKKIKAKLPDIKIRPKVGDYFEILQAAKSEKEPKLILFLGSNIGNYTEEKAKTLLCLIHKNLNAKDKLLIGFDLQKNPIAIQQAYYDKQGITKRFNLNLLRRINEELHADFKLEDFDFYSHYNPETGEVRSYLVSLKNQEVHFKKLDKTISFKKDELIWTELSKKYTVAQIESMAIETGFKVIDHFKDSKKYFTDSLWEK